MKIESLSLDDAKIIIAAAEDRARAIARPMNIAVADAGGNLIAHHRMDGAWIGSIDLAINKAFTARAFDMPTGLLWEHSQPGGQAYGIQQSIGGRVVALAGGFPVVVDGLVIGAIGVSGGYGTEDVVVAEAALAVFAELDRH